MTPPRLRIIQKDTTGRTAAGVTYVGAEADPDVCIAGASLWNECSVATLTNATRERDLFDTDPDTGGDGAYSNSQDLMALLFLCDDMSVVQCNVSSPNASCFEDDAETVRNSGDSPAVGLIAWLIEHGVSKNGARFTEYRKGWRWRANVV